MTTLNQPLKLPVMRRFSRAVVAYGSIFLAIYGTLIHVAGALGKDHLVRVSLGTPDVDVRGSLVGRKMMYALEKDPESGD